jgi:hypothetical protein
MFKKYSFFSFFRIKTDSFDTKKKPDSTKKVTDTKIFLIRIDFIFKSKKGK